MEVVGRGHLELQILYRSSREKYVFSQVFRYRTEYILEFYYIDIWRIDR